MPKLKATREGTLVYLPKYENAEMLTLEFFSGDTVAITPMKNLGAADFEDFTILTIHAHTDVLDQLINYVNANI